MNTVITEQKPKTELEYTNCDFCGEDKTNLFLEAMSEDTPEKFKIVRCNNCGLLYLNPRPVKEIIGRYYPVDSYYAYQDFLNKRFNYREWLKKISLDGYYNSKNSFKKFLSLLLVRNFMIVVPKEKRGRLLDIGCGSGEFLYQMKSYGWNVYGVEISQASANIGNKRGLNISCGELGGADFSDNFFDVVVLNQTLEHVYSPSSYLKEIHRILKPEGTLIIAVPNIGCMESKMFKENWHLLDVPTHLYFFNTTSLRRYLEKYGFAVEEVLSKRFSLPLNEIRADLKAVIQNECKDKSFLNKTLMSIRVISRLIIAKSLRFLFIRDKVEELGIYISFYVRKPRIRNAIPCTREHSTQKDRGLNSMNNFMLKTNKRRILRYSKRCKIVQKYCFGKTVLDLGCVDHSAEAEENFNDWLHKGIKDVAKEVVGLDNAEKEVKLLNQRGYDILAGDVENFNLGRRFEVVVCGELIEHVNNPGLVLQNIKKHLLKEGTLIVTTPNSESMLWVLYNLVYGRVPCNPTHVSWYNYQTLTELCRRYDFEVVTTYYEVGNPNNRVLYNIERFMRSIRKNWAHELIVIFKNKH